MLDRKGENDVIGTTKFIGARNEEWFESFQMSECWKEAISKSKCNENIEQSLLHKKAVCSTTKSKIISFLEFTSFVSRQISCLHSTLQLLSVTVSAVSICTKYHESASTRKFFKGGIHLGFPLCWKTIRLGLMLFPVLTICDKFWHYHSSLSWFGLNQPLKDKILFVS